MRLPINTFRRLPVETSSLVHPLLTKRCTNRPKCTTAASMTWLRRASLKKSIAKLTQPKWNHALWRRVPKHLPNRSCRFLSSLRRRGRLFSRVRRGNSRTSHSKRLSQNLPSICGKPKPKGRFMSQAILTSRSSAAIDSPSLLYSPVYQAYRLLHVAFVVAPIVAGLDKFFRILVDWDQYLAPIVPRVLGGHGHQFMPTVGVI